MEYSDGSISSRTFLRELRQEIDKYKTLKEMADNWGVPYQAIQRARDGGTPSPRILEIMGLKPVKQIKYRYLRVKK